MIHIQCYDNFFFISFFGHSPQPILSLALYYFLCSCFSSQNKSWHFELTFMQPTEKFLVCINKCFTYNTFISSHTRTSSSQYKNLFTELSTLPNNSYNTIHQISNIDYMILLTNTGYTSNILKNCSNIPDSYKYIPKHSEDHQ